MSKMEIWRNALQSALDSIGRFDVLTPEEVDKAAAHLAANKTLRDETDDSEDICGFCGQPGADKIPHPFRWPGERSAGTEFVHAGCEEDECRRAHSLLSDEQRMACLRTI